MNLTGLLPDLSKHGLH